jgi:hypothetical protein
LGGLLLLTTALTSGFSSETPYLGHVLPVSTYGYTTFTSSFASFLCGKFMCVASLVRDLASFTRNLTLLFSIHSGKSS